MIKFKTLFAAAIFTLFAGVILTGTNFTVSEAHAYDSKKSKVTQEAKDKKKDKEDSYGSYRY